MEGGIDLPGVDLSKLFNDHVADYRRDKKFVQAEVIRLELFGTTEDMCETLAPVEKQTGPIEPLQWRKAYINYSPRSMGQLLIVGDLVAARLVRVNHSSGEVPVPRQLLSPALANLGKQLNLDLLDVDVHTGNPAPGEVVLFMRSRESKLDKQYGNRVMQELEPKLAHLPNVRVLIQNQTPALFLDEQSFPMVYRFDATINPKSQNALPEVSGVQCHRLNGSPFMCDELNP